MKSRFMYVFLASLGLIALPGLVLAADSSPDFSRPEKAALALIDGLLTAASAVVEHQDCHQMAFFYRVSVDTFWDGSGSARLDRLTLEISESASSNKGNVYGVSAPAGDLAYAHITDFVGTYAFDEPGSIFRGSAAMQIVGAEYGNEVIADFWAETAPPYDILEKGFEVINKVDYPRAQWLNRLVYHRPGATDGSIVLTKTRIAPTSAMDCSMTFSAFVDNFGGGFETFNGLLIIEN